MMKLKLNWLAFLLVGLLIGGIVVTVVSYLAFQEGSLVETQEALQAPLVAEKSMTDEAGREGMVESEEFSQNSTDRMVIKSKYLTLTVEDVKESYLKAETIASKYGGFIVSSNIYSGNSNQPRTFESISENKTGPLFGTVVLKVTAEKFDEAVKELKELGDVKSEQESMEEVTQQHIDLSARLKNLKRQEERYLKILDSAESVEDMLKIEEQLSRIRGDIESMQAQLDYLERSTAMATITLELSEPAVISEPIMSWRIRDAFTRAVRNFVAVINIFIVTVGTILPLVIIAVLIWLLVIFLRKRKK